MLRTFLSTARRASVALLSAAVLVTPSACSDSSTGPRASVNVIGTYALLQVDGVELPAEIHSGPYLDPASQHQYNEFLVNLSDGGIELDANGNMRTWFDTFIIADGSIFTRHFEVSGTYKANGSRVTAYAANGQLAGTFSVTNDEIVGAADVWSEGRTREYRFRR